MTPFMFLFEFPFFLQQCVYNVHIQGLRFGWRGLVFGRASPAPVEFLQAFEKRLSRCHVVLINGCQLWCQYNRRLDAEAYLMVVIELSRCPLVRFSSRIFYGETITARRA